MDIGGRIYWPWHWHWPWHCRGPRCVLPLEKLHVPTRIKTYLRKGLFELSFDRDPDQVLRARGAAK